jgi:hypothetical protein
MITKSTSNSNCVYKQIYVFLLDNIIYVMAKKTENKLPNYLLQFSVTLDYISAIIERAFN